MVVNVNTKLYDNTLDRAAMIRLYERRVNEKVSVIIDDHESRLDAVIRKGDLSVAQRKDLMEKIDEELRKTYTAAFRITKKSLLDLAIDQVSFTFQRLETAIGEIWNPERPEKSVAENIVLEKPLYKDVTLAQGWANVSLAEKKRLEAVIRKGIAENKSLDVIALDVRRNNIHNISRAQSKALVVTAVTSVAAQSDHAVYKANSKALAGWQYVAVLDSRTTPICAHRDGTIYPIGDTLHLPPAHFRCRSTSVPIVKSWEDLGKLDSVANIRSRNFKKLTPEQIAAYDGATPLRETYNDWLKRQPKEVQLRHLGDYQKLDLFTSGKITLDKFTNDEGNSIGIRELRALTDSGYTPPDDTVRFANAKMKLDAMRIGASSPDDFLNDKVLENTLKDYYILQAKELDGTLSLTNYRGLLLHNKKATKASVLNSPPREDQLKFNPITGRYEDVRLYQPNKPVLENALRLVDTAEDLTDKDKEFIKRFVSKLDSDLGFNERAVVSENLRILFSRARRGQEPWVNFKAVAQDQIKFDVINISDNIETQIRKDSDILKKLLQDNYIDPVLGPTQLSELSENFLANISAKNKWEDSTAPKIARKLRNVFDHKIPPVIWARVSDRDLQQFYLKFAKRLSLADSPDIDELAVSLGRDLYNLANLNGTRTKWHTLGKSLLESKNAKQFYEIETFGVQKRRMKSKMSGAYFGPKYDTVSYYLRITDPTIQEYAKLTRKVELGLRVSVVNDKNRLVFRKGYKTYFIDRGILGYEDTRIPITSTSSFSDFPEEFVDENMVDALNWTSKSKYKIDQDFYDFVDKLLYFEDDRGNAKKYNELNEFRKYLSSRGDAYERLKAMEWLRKTDQSFSNHPFIDHRARIYERGLIGPQSGETFRPFLNTDVAKNFSADDFYNLQDQIGSFLGGLNDHFEGRFNSLTFTGRQKIAAKWRPELVKLGNHMLRGKPADLRAILESDFASKVDGEELAKFYRFAMEAAKIDNYLGGNYSAKNLEKLSDYKTALALEQDASSSGAQIIALTTRNKRLAELSNVIPTNQKKRLYDEIAAATYNDPRFRKLNLKLGLSEKDLRKAAKAQNMVTFYGAGEKTGALNVEGKLAKVLEKEENVLVVRATERDAVLSEISARMARYEKFDPETAEELRVLRQNVKDIFDKGVDPGDDILEQLYFLDPKTKDFVEKLSRNYDKVVTPEDFKEIAKIMSSHLAEEVPILKDFTKFFGNLAEDYITYAKPSQSDFDWKTLVKTKVLGSKKSGYKLPDRVSEILGIKANESLSEKALKRLGVWKPNGTLSEIIYGVEAPKARRTGAKYMKVDLLQVKNLSEVEIGIANKLPKSWTNVPWVNFDGKVIEQNFTQAFEERIVYKDKFGNYTTNILKIPQKTEATWWEQVINKSGKINDIGDLSKAKTAFAVNGNHSNDAVIVKKFHLWGKKNGIATSTVHDAFFANAADMQKGRDALRQIYAESLDANPVLNTLNEMRARGLPEEVYNRYLEEAVLKGLIPVPGKSVVGGKVLTINDILTKDDILKAIPKGFKQDTGWYGVG